MPRNPCRPASTKRSWGTMPSFSQSRWWGTTSLSSHARKLARRASCSSSNRSRSTVATRLFDPGLELLDDLGLIRPDRRDVEDGDARLLEHGEPFLDIALGAH